MGLESMAMGSERSKSPLHNFTLPCGLKWGNQKFLRCVKLDSTGKISAVNRRSNGHLPENLIGGRRRSEDDVRFPRRGSDERASRMGALEKGTAEESGREFHAAGVEDRIAAVRKKLMCDFQAATDKMRDEILRKGLRDKEDVGRQPVVENGEERSPAPATTLKTIIPVGQSETATDAADSTAAMPWNLRTRRSGSKQPNGFAGRSAARSGESDLGLKADAAAVVANSSPLRSENKSTRLRSSSAVAGSCAGTSSGGEKRERAKFSIALSRREIEEDFAAIVHNRPPRRPKKRAKNIQKNLDTLFPGLWLAEITPDMYKVSDDQ